MTIHNPAHPGEILKELVIEPLELTITDVAEHLNVSRKTLSKALNGRGAITPEMAARLELAFAKPTADTGCACKMLMIYQLSEIKRQR